MYFQSLATDHLINTDHDRLIGSWILIIRNLSAHEYGLETSRHINMDRNKTWQHFNMDHHKLYSSWIWIITAHEYGWLSLFS